jgi:hypothetical protein
MKHEQMLEIHREAMDWAEKAMISRFNGDLDIYRNAIDRALELEQKAATSIGLDFDFEPTRSVLLRSAASIAIECNKLEVAERLISLALYGNPPTEIAEELRDLLEQVYFGRHLKLRGITLSTNELQFSIAGEMTGTGITQSEPFIHRVQTIETIVFRTAERKLKKPFRKAGRPSKEIIQKFQPFLTIPRAASYAISIRLGSPAEQFDVFSPEPSSEIVDEIFGCLDDFENDEFSKLENRISNTEYYDNFIGLAKQLAPDGKDINLVGLTIMREGKPKELMLTKHKLKSESILPIIPTEEISTTVTLKGKLHYANAIKTKNIIKLEDKDGRSHQIRVPEGMMNDIVRPLWDEFVEVNTVKEGKYFKLSDIQKADE